MDRVVAVAAIRDDELERFDAGEIDVNPLGRVGGGQPAASPQELPVADDLELDRGGRLLAARRVGFIVDADDRGPGD